MYPSEDRTDTVEANDGTFILSNGQPQTVRLNRGPWKALEGDLQDLVRARSEAYIYAGCYGGTERLSVVKDEYAVSQDGLKMFGVMDLDAAFEGGRFSIGLRNSNDKSMRLALTAGYRVFVCDNMAFSGDFSPLLHKHTTNHNLTDSIAVAVDRIYRGLDSIANQIKLMRNYGLTDNDARLIIYRAFVEKALKGVPRQMMPAVHANYFDPAHEDFRSRNLWSLSNAFTSAFKSLGPLKQFEATAKLGPYLSGIKADAASAERRSLIDCGTGKFRLVKGEDGKLKEEEIPDASGWGDSDGSMVDEKAARAAG